MIGIEVLWDDPGESILRWNFQVEWLWADFNTAFEQSLVMIGSVGQRVDLIPFAEMVVNIPIGVLGEFKRLQRHLPPNTGLIVVTGGSRFTNTVIDTFVRLNDIQSWRTAATLEEARSIIAADRASMGGL